MKNLLLLLLLLPLGLFAQEEKNYLSRSVTIKPTRYISSSTEFIGKKGAMFKVVRARDADLRGCEVYARVLECRKSNLSGSEGRLIIRPLYILDKDGNKISVYGDIYIRGLNRSNIKFILWFVPVMWFIPGGGAGTDSDEFQIYFDELAE